MSPVPLKNNDLICIDTSKNILWISRDTPPEHIGLSSNVLPLQKDGDRYCPTIYLFKPKNEQDMDGQALSIAYLVAWVAGLGIQNVTELYTGRPKELFIFKTMQA
jgi:hypothetical protein